MGRETEEDGRVGRKKRKKPEGLSMDRLVVSVRVTDDVRVLDDDSDLQCTTGCDASTRLMLSATGCRAGPSALAVAVRCGASISRPNVGTDTE